MAPSAEHQVATVTPALDAGLEPAHDPAVPEGDDPPLQADSAIRLAMRTRARVRLAMGFSRHGLRLRAIWSRVRDTGQGCLRADGEDEGGPRLLAEVEVLRQVAEDRAVLPDIWPAIRAPVGLRVEALAGQEVVLDELEVSIERQRLVVDVARLRVGADHDGRYPQSVAEAVDLGRGHVVVEAAPVVPGEEDGRGVPVRAAHDG